MNIKLFILILCAFSLFACSTGQKAVIKRDATPAPMPKEQEGLFKADFRYSPPWWQTAICLPDDWQKTLVSKEGALLYDYPGEFSGFGTKVAISLEGTAGTSSVQLMENPRVPIVETVLSDPTGKELVRWSALAVVPGDDQNLPIHKKSAGLKYEKPPRGDLLLIKKSAKAYPISLIIQSKQPLEITDLTVFRGGQRFLSMSPTSRDEPSARHSPVACNHGRVRRKQIPGRSPGPRPPWTSIMLIKNGLKVIFPARIEELAVYCASGHEAGKVKLEWAKAQLERAASYWSSQDFPYDSIRLPDAAMQGILDSCIRNIYQAREIKDGLPIFQVGPTCYRGLWVVDGAFILEAMTFLGRGEEARSGIRHLLTRQKPDGSFEILANYWKENGIVLYILYRHALLTQDSAWLKQNWETVKRVVHVIQELRKRSRSAPSAPEAGLMPPGFPDGGIGGVAPEYTNVYWNLAGLRAAVEAARLVQAPELAEWEAEYKDFYAAFQAAVKRDAKPVKGRAFAAEADPRAKPGAPAAVENGLLFLPILMKPEAGIDPVRGQWAFCHAVYPGKLFGPNDPLALGNMQLLDNHEKEGLVVGTGWMARGIWNYFASFYGHAHLWLGHSQKAAEILYAFANHASPMRAWREEQAPQGEEKGEKSVGDMPHNWASAEFIRLTRNLLVLERSAEVHLLERIPRPWLAPGAVTELKNIATDSGPVSMKLEVAADGKEAHLSMTAPKNKAWKRTVVHLGAWAAEGKIALRKKERGWELTIPLMK